MLTPPVSTGDRQHPLQDSRIPQMVVGTPNSASSAESGIDHDDRHSAPRIETRYIDNGSDSSSDEITVITHAPPPNAATPPAPAHASPERSKATTIADGIEAALLANDCRAFRKLLASHPAAINAPLPGSNSPLLVMAVSRGQRDIVAALLEADDLFLDARDASDKNAIYVACEAGDLELTRLLVRHGASLDTRCKGSTPLIAACRSMNPALLDYVLRKTPTHLIDFRSPGGTTALVQAIGCRNIDAVNKLIHYGADPNRIGGSGITPLHIAAEQDDVALAGLLIRHGAVQRKAMTGYPLDVAIRSGCSPMVALLLKNPPAGEEWKASALESAIRVGSMETIRMLIDRGVSPDTDLPGAVSPLMLAADLGSTGMVIYLLARGADAGHLSPMRHSALSRAIRKRRSRYLILLLLSAMPETVTLEPRLAAQFIRRAKRRSDQRILNEMATKKFEDQSGRAYDVRRLLN